MPGIFIAPPTLPRVALLLAIVFAAAMVLYRYRNRQLNLQTRELETLLLRLQQRDTHRTESFATTIHELRAPLTSIRGALVLLSAGAGSLDERAANLLRIATGNTGRLVRLIDDLLELERMDSAAGAIELQPCSLDELLAQAIDTMTPMAQVAAIDIETLPAPGSLQFAGDRNRILQVLCNLLSNAIKFSPAGSVITLSLREEPSHILLRIQDEGRGVPADKLETIFDRFVRLDPPPPNRNEPGRPGTAAPACSGLGLAISRSLVTLHGGTLHAERNDSTCPGIPGTTLILRLPRRAPDSLSERLESGST